MSCQQLNTLAVKLRTNTILCRGATILVLMVLLVASLSARAQAVPAVHFAFDETSGSTAADSVGNLVGDLVTGTSGGFAPTFVPGRFGNALYTDGFAVNNDTPGMDVRTGDFSVIDFGTTTDFSIAYWLKSDVNYFIQGAETILSGLYGEGGTFNANAFYFSAVRAGGFNGQYLRYGAPGSGDIQPSSAVDGPALVTDDAWHHYAWTMDRDGTTNMFVDGEVVDTVEFDSTGIDFTGASGLDVSGDQYNGSIDELYLFNEALLPNQVEALFNSNTIVTPDDPPISFEWNVTGLGIWDRKTNWNPANDPRGGPPSGDNEAIFGDVVDRTAPSSVIVDSDVTVARIQFDNTNTYAIVGAASVNLAQSEEFSTAIDVEQGDHEFQAVVNLQADTTASVASDSTLTFNNALNLGDNDLTTTGPGEVVINNDLTGDGTVIVLGGILSGNGSVAGGVNNQGGTISPGNSPGLMAINGDFTQAEQGTLFIELAGTAAGTEYDVLQVDGAVNLGGALAVSLLSGFAPTKGDTFNILELGVVSGQFNEVLLPKLVDGLAWDDSVLYSNGSLSVVPEPNTLLLYLSGGLISVVFGSRRRNDRGRSTT